MQVTESVLSEGLFAGASAALGEADVNAKLYMTHVLCEAWLKGSLQRKACAILDVQRAGRPSRPILVHPRYMPRRGLGSPQGRITMMHAIAHIEFNAINLALDAVQRFQEMPEAYYGDWLQVAGEEARHFSMVRDWLCGQGSDYGAYDAHNGLWEMAEKTAGGVLERMALVPRVLEARGLDVTPGIINKLKQAEVMDIVDILQLIYQEEIGHVRIGNRWFNYCCEQRGLVPETIFFTLLERYYPKGLFGPFNLDARKQAGFSERELEMMRQDPLTAGGKRP